MLKKINFLFISIALFVSHPIIAQTTDFQQNYQPLVSSGKLPNAVTTPSSRKYKKQLNRISKYDEKAEKELKKDFFLSSNFVIDDLLRSGYILYNDPLGKYVNEVADIVLKQDPTLRKKLQFYVMRSAEVNAFTTDQGVIFVSMGLLSQLENEAQLAFILCHEIIHFQKEHGLDLFLEVDKINQETSTKYVLNKSTLNKNLFKFSFSRELETEADLDGFELYKKTNYDLESLTGVFNVLAYSYLPFDDLPFKQSFFEHNQFQFPSSYQIEEVKQISTVELSDDSKSTHPNIIKRKLKIRSLNTQLSNEGRLSYILGQKRFEEIQKIARFEVPLLSLNEQEYYRAIFESYMLLQEYPENIYLKKCLAKGLYLAAKFRNEGYSYESDIREFEGEIQGLIHFISKLSNKELNILAAKYTWESYAKKVKDEELAFIAKDALTELIFWHDMKLTDFKKSSTSIEKVATDESPSTVAANRNTKMEKIQALENTTSQQKEFWRTAFSQFLGFPHFNKIWEESNKKAIDRKKRQDYYSTWDGKQEYEEYVENKKKNGLRMDLDKVVIVNPFYLNLDERKDNSILYEKGEKSQVTFHKLLKDNAKLCGLKTQVLDVESIRPNEVEKFNDLAFLNEWFANQGDYNELYLTPGLRQQEINAIADKYGTNFFCWTGIISLRTEKSKLPYLAAIYPLMWPSVIKYALKKPYECLYYKVVYNIKTGAREVVKFQYLDTADTKSVLNLHVYDAFLQIKSK